MSFLFELEPRDEAAVDLVTNVGKQLQRAVIARGLTQNEIAQKLGVDRSRINKCLSGFNNLTLKSLAELSWAMDGKIKIQIDLFAEEQQQTVEDVATNVVTFVGRQASEEQEQSALRDPEDLRRVFG